MTTMTAQAPLISIVMPLYNKEKEVCRSIDSVLAQTYKDFELIVVDDGSTDNGPQIARLVQDNRIKIIDQDNFGVSVARNTGIKEAKANLIAFLDADDEWKTKFLETIIRLTKNFPDCDVFATNYLIREPDGKHRRAIVRDIPGSPWEGVFTDYFYIASKSDPPLWSSAVAVTRKAIIAVQGFPVSITSGEDLLTWARLASRFKIAYSNTPQAVFWRPKGVTSREGRFDFKEDIVARELETLLCNASIEFKKGMKAYLGLWHTMRACIFIELGDQKEALLNIKKALEFSGVTFKLAVLFVLAHLPVNLSVWFYKTLSNSK